MTTTPDNVPGTPRASRPSDDREPAPASGRLDPRSDEPGPAPGGPDRAGRQDELDRGVLDRGVLDRGERLDRTSPTAPVPMEPTIKRTRISGTWVAVIVAAIVLIFLLVFILQNLTTATVNFLGFSGSLPLGVAMLFAAIAGAILVALIGTARILQLRRFAKRVGSSRSP